jgi:hypothetical protein
MRVAVVRFKAEAVAAFRDALVRHATTSLACEPGCLQLDFAADLTSPVHFLTYEGVRRRDRKGRAVKHQHGMGTVPALSSGLNRWHMRVGEYDHAKQFPSSLWLRVEG